MPPKQEMSRFTERTGLCMLALCLAFFCLPGHAQQRSSQRQSKASAFNAKRDKWLPASKIVHPSNPAYRNGPIAPPVTSWPPAGNPVRVPIVKDDWFSAYKGERNRNSGKANMWKLKGQIEYSIFDIDLSALRGKVVTGALLHMKTASPNWPYRRVGISSVASKWEEGTASKAYQEVPGAPCYEQAELGKRDWAYKGSTIMDVVLGRGHTLWKFADCTAPNKKGWQAVAVDPDVVAARVSGLSHGFFCYDEVGHEWKDTNNKFKYWSNPNRFSYSKDSRFPPYLEVWVNGIDSQAPQAVSYIKVETESFPPGEAMVKWITPADNGPAGVAGYLVTYRGEDGNVKQMPRYLIPMAQVKGAECRMHIQDIPFKAGEKLTLTIKAVDKAGNVGPAFKHQLKVSDHARAYKIADSGASPYRADSTRLKVNGITVSVIDLMDKVDPRSGSMVPKQKPGYKYANHIFSSKEKKIRLYNGRNEFNFIQILLEADKAKAEVEVSFPNTGIKPELFEFAYVNQVPEGTKEHYILPDPLLPVKGAVTIPSTAGKVKVPNQKSHSLVCDIYVPHNESPGLKKGKLTVKSGGETLEIPIEMTIWDFTLPNKLSFVPEMNSYQHARPEVYRLAHKYRTCLNALPYVWSCHPRWGWQIKDGKLDLDLIDKELAPLFDGSMFKDLPRSGEPVDIAYMAFNEGWPTHLPDHFKGSYWADEAFSDEYISNMQKAMAAFAKHADQKGWHNTLFHLFMNNKIYFRARTTNVQAPWILDEPRETSDYWALRWYGLVLHDAIKDVKGKAKLMNRCDISYSQFERNLMWGTVDWACLGGTTPHKLRLKYDEFRLWGKTYLSAYGSANHIHMPNTQPAKWTLQAWLNGCDSLLNWQTRSRGRPNSWVHGWEQAIFLPYKGGLAASVRLRAHTRGQQLIEYITMLMYWNKVPRFQMANGLRDAADFSAKVVKRYESDAGRIEFSSQSPVGIWKLQMDLGAMVHQRKPPYRASLKDWAPINIDVNRLPNVGYTPVAPQVKSHGPKIDTFQVR